jgi:hypothetical protein
MKIRPVYALALLLLVLLSGACQAAPAATETVVVTDQPDLTGEFGGVRGVILSNITNEPIDSIIVRLAEVVRQGDQSAYVLDQAFSPGATTQADGSFQIANAPAGEYVLVVGNPEIFNGHEILQDSSGTSIKYIVTAGEWLDIGDIRVDLTGDEY